ncbi:MAG: hypothetical protein ACOC9T_00505 [Myxococcota bacterium]
MSMDAGDENVEEDTMAKSIYDRLVEQFEEEGEDPSFDESRRKTAAAIAQGIVDHLTEHAEVEVTISDATGGLQTTTTEGNPTDPPATDQTLGGSLT